MLNALKQFIARSPSAYDGKKLSKVLIIKQLTEIRRQEGCLLVGKAYTLTQILRGLLVLKKSLKVFISNVLHYLMKSKKKLAPALLLLGQ
jgi:hypothetical protein